MRAYVGDVIEQARRRFGPRRCTSPAEIRLLDGYQGAGRAEVRARGARRSCCAWPGARASCSIPSTRPRPSAGCSITCKRDPGSSAAASASSTPAASSASFPFREALSRLADADLW